MTWAIDFRLIEFRLTIICSISSFKLWKSTMVTSLIELVRASIILYPKFRSIMEVKESSSSWKSVLAKIVWLLCSTYHKGRHGAGHMLGLLLRNILFFEIGKQKARKA